MPDVVPPRQARIRRPEYGASTLSNRVNMPGPSTQRSASTLHSHRQMSMPNQCVRTWRPPLPRRRRSSTPGCSSWTRNHPPTESVFPRARHGRSLPRSSELAFRDTYPASGPNREPGRILIPGDGAAGDQRAQNRPACPAMAARDACGLSRLNDLLALWSQAHMPSCNRQVTSTSIRMAEPGSDSAPRGHAPL